LTSVFPVNGNHQNAADYLLTERYERPYNHVPSIRAKPK